MHVEMRSKTPAPVNTASSDLGFRQLFRRAARVLSFTVCSLSIAICVGCFGAGSLGGFGSTDEPKVPTAVIGGPYSGVVGQPVSFDATKSTAPSGQTLTYTWFFGDDTSGNGDKATHTYSETGTYNVTLNLSASGGGSVTATTTLTVGAGATANAGGPYSGFVNQAIAFDGSKSVAPPGQTLTYAWNFGDEGSASSIKPTHTYATAGNYKAVLTVTASSGGSSQATASVAVNSVLSANAGGPYTGSTGRAVDFDGSKSIAPAGQSLTWAWDFGDKTTGSGSSPSHTYSAAGTFQVVLTVTASGDGSTAKATTSVTVTAAPAATVASAIADEIVNASTPEQNFLAILDCLKAMNVGIYAPDGTVVTTGAERTLGDFYLYNFEVGPLADLAESQELSGYEALIPALGFLDTSPFRDPSAFHKALTSAAATALKNDSDPKNFTLLLVRELGLRTAASYDLADSPSRDSVEFTPLQQWLLQMEFSLPFLASLPPAQNESYVAVEGAPTSPPPASGSQSSARIGSAWRVNKRATSRDFAPHDSIPRDSTPQAGADWGTGGLYNGMNLTNANYSRTFAIDGTTENLTPATMSIIKAEHGFLLSRLLEIDPTGDTPLVMNFGDTAHSVSFTVQVPQAKWNLFQQQLDWEKSGPGPFKGIPLTSLFPVTSVVVAGPVVGLTLPKGPGPVENVDVIVNYDGLLSYLSAFDCAEVCKQPTDSAGSVKISVTPQKDETKPNEVSIEKSTAGVLFAQVDATRAFGSSGSTINGQPVNNYVPIQANVPYLVKWKVPGSANVTFVGNYARSGTATAVFPEEGGSGNEYDYLQGNVAYSFVQTGDLTAYEDPATGSGAYLFPGTFNFFGTSSYARLSDASFSSVCSDGNGNAIGVTMTTKESDTYAGEHSFSIPGTIEIDVDGKAQTTKIIPQVNIAPGSTPGIPIQAVTAGSWHSPCISGSGEYSGSGTDGFLPNWDPIILNRAPATGQTVVDLSAVQNDYFIVSLLDEVVTDRDGVIAIDHTLTLNFDLDSTLTQMRNQSSSRKGTR